jgi:DNA polymerase-3 subunit delta'
VSDRAGATDLVEAVSSRDTSIFYGHAAAEQVLLNAYRSDRFPHGWLLSGPSGIGKATLAYRFARYILVNPDRRLLRFHDATSLHVDQQHPVARRIAAQAHPDLLVLERTLNEKTNRLRQNISVDDVRRSVPFFGSTAAEGGWRIAIVDTVDELNTQGANALLKILEEPPQRAVLLLVSHSPARVPATIRSRCRFIRMRGLAAIDVARAVAAASGRAESDPEVTAAAAVAEGSVRRALELLDSSALDLRNGVWALLERLPAVEPDALHALGDRLYGTDQAKLATFVETVNGWLASRLRNGPQQGAALDKIATVWGKFNQAARDVDAFNLERKSLVFNVFTWLAEASRG